MIRISFITAFRRIRHNKLFSLINVLGLSIGISAALVIYLIVSYEFSFDTFHKDGNRIYRVVTKTKYAGADPYYNCGIPDPLPLTALKEVPGIEDGTAIYTAHPVVSIPANTSAIFKKQDGITYTDNRYFRFFNFYQWLAGSPATALNDPFRVVLTEDRARTYFPGADLPSIIGRQIVYDDSIRVTVSGILRVPDVTTDLTFREFISMATIYSSNLKTSLGLGDWNSITSASQFFVRLIPSAKPTRIESQLAALRKKYSADASDTSTTTAHLLQPLSDLHFNPLYYTFDQPQASRSTLYGLILVAIFLLLLACINFINLTTAQAGRRAKEIGIRKTLGSSGSRLILQFLGETFLLTLLSLILSLLLTPWLLNIFSDFIPPGLHFTLEGQPGIYIFLTAILLAVTLLSGFYPAILLSRFLPVLVLKNQAFSGTTATRGAWLRKTLTVSQFIIAQVFIMATIIVARQIRFSIDSDLGFKKDAIFYLHTPYRSLASNRLAFLQKIHSIPGIAMIATGGNPPSSSGFGQMSMDYKDGKQDVQVQVQNKGADTNYIALYHIPILAGRNFRSGDTTNQILINMTFARMLGFNDPQNAIGKSVSNGHPFPIIGVVSDFHQGSMHQPIKPLVFTCDKEISFNFHIALQPQQAGAGWTATLAQIQSAYKQFFPEEAFDYQFVDESIAKFYTAEQHIASLLKWATALMIFISCLGLAGLVIYTTNQRTKEIGIRKVLGASISTIVTLLSADFVRLMGLAFLIASPIAWWSMHKWLENFVYRTSMNWWLFPLSGITMMAIALATMSIRTIRAASANPVKSLRTE